MASAPPAPAGSATWRRVLVLALMLGVTLALRLVVSDDLDVGVGYLNLVPVVVAAIWFGRGGGVFTAVAATALFVLSSAIEGDDMLLVSGLIRLGVYVAAGYVVAALAEQRLELRVQVAEQDRELTELRAIQSALAPPRFVPRPGLDIAATYVPASGGVAGDFYIVASGPQDATIVVVGDVVGKGLEAARRASFVRASLVTFTEFTDDPVRLLDMANHSLIERAGTSDVFVTAACLVHRPAERSVAWALAGHPPPFRLDGGGELDAGYPGMPLGLELDIGCRAARADLPPGSGIVLFSDGLVEAKAANNGQRFGLGRFERALVELAGRDARTVVDDLRGRVEQFSGGELIDDLCLVALRAMARPSDPAAAVPPR